MSLLRYGWTALIAFVAINGPAKADVVFTDNTFNLSNYNTTTPFATDPSISIAVTQCATCGFGSTAGLQTIATLTSTPGQESAGETLVNTTFHYNPSVQGAITSIDGSVEKDIFTSLTGTGFGNAFRLTIEQGGVFYLDPIPGLSFTGPNSATNPGYALISGTDLLASDFVSYDPTTGATGSGHPNFAGSAMLFGLTQNSGSAGTGTITADYDNLNIDLHTVPEPASLTILASALVGLGLFRRRRVGRSNPPRGA